MVKPRNQGAGSNLVDTGRNAAHDYLRWMVDSIAGSVRRRGGHGEGLRRNHGDAVGAELDAKPVDRFTVNTGTILRCSRRPESIRVGGIDTSSIEGAGWGGGLVVVRARERRAHGEEDQQVGGEEVGMPGGRG